VVNHIEDIILKAQAFGWAQEKLQIPVLPAAFLLALLQHAPGNIDAIITGCTRQVLNISACSNGCFQDTVPVFNL